MALTQPSSAVVRVEPASHGAQGGACAEPLPPSLVARWCWTAQDDHNRWGVQGCSWSMERERWYPQQGPEGSAARRIEGLARLGDPGAELSPRRSGEGPAALARVPSNSSPGESSYPGMGYAQGLLWRQGKGRRPKDSPPWMGARNRWAEHILHRRSGGKGQMGDPAADPTRIAEPRAWRAGWHFGVGTQWDGWSTSTPRAADSRGLAWSHAKAARDVRGWWVGPSCSSPLSAKVGEANRQVCGSARRACAERSLRGSEAGQEAGLWRRGLEAHHRPQSFKLAASPVGWGHPDPNRSSQLPADHGVRRWGTFGERRRPCVRLLPVCHATGLGAFHDVGQAGAGTLGWAPRRGLVLCGLVRLADGLA